MTGDTKTVETPLIGIEALTSQQKPLLDNQASTQNDQLAQRIILVQAEREKLALELELLRLKHAKSPTLTPSTTDTETSAAAVTKKTHHVDWPQDFSPGMSTNVEYDKLDLSEFVAGYLSMIKTYAPEETKFILSHLKLLMIKGTSYSWSSVRSFHAHIAKQVELYRLEWSDTAEIPDRANTFFKHSDLCRAPTSRVKATPPSTTRSKQDGGQETRGCKPWNYTGSCTCEKDNDTYPVKHKCRVCTQDHLMLHCPKRRNPIRSTFWQPTSPPPPNFLRSIRPRACHRRMSFRTRYHTQERRASFHWTLILRDLTSPLLSVTSLLPNQIAPTHLGQKSRCIPHWRLTGGKIFCLIIMIRSWWNIWSMVGRSIIAPVNRLIPQCAIILLSWLFLITYGTTFRPSCLSERSPVLSRQTRYISL